MNYNFKVNLGGMIDILANHLYSSPNVFIRELLQNGVDAISARKKHEPSFKNGKISIRVTEGYGLHFCDNGIGLTEEEMHKFLAVIGETSKRNTTQIYEDYIGRFGIGLLSCFMVTEQIVMRTRSVTSPNVALEWIGKPDGTYNINKIEDDSVPIGTQVIITAKPDSRDYFTREEVIHLVRYFGLPLPIPVVLVDNYHEIVINEFNVSNVMNRAEVMRIGEELFNEKFMDVIPLVSPTGKFHGMAYILSYEVTPHNTQSHRIYLKNMLLTEDGEMILPKWAFFVKCFFNTTTLRPTASRENFYKDEELAEAKKEIARCISSYFISLSQQNPQLLNEILNIHNAAIKAICVTDDELYKLFIPFLRFQTTMGIITGQDIVRYGSTVYYTATVNRYKQISPFFISQMRLLLNAGYMYDKHLIERMKKFYPQTDIQIIREDGMNEFLEEPEPAEIDGALSFLVAAKFTLSPMNCEPVLKRFYPESLPAFYYMDEAVKQARKINENLDKLKQSNDTFSGMLSGFAEEAEIYEKSGINAPILYFNLNNPIVKQMVTFDDAQKIKALVHILYVQSLMAGSLPVSGSDLELFNAGIATLLESTGGWLYSVRFK